MCLESIALLPVRGDDPAKYFTTNAILGRIDLIHCEMDLLDNRICPMRLAATFVPCNTECLLRTYIGLPVDNDGLLDHTQHVYADSILEDVRRLRPIQVSGDTANVATKAGMVWISKYHTRPIDSDTPLDLKVILTLTPILTELEAVITYFGIPTLLDSLEACSHKPLVAAVERVDVVLDLAWEEVHSWF
jgi:hypothetical protein